jgi:hypothetical protein
LLKDKLRKTIDIIMSAKICFFFLFRFGREGGYSPPPPPLDARLLDENVTDFSLVSKRNEILYIS